ncbi:AAA family ATPase [Nonomuraea angiospora]|uniref:helix-turn-helix transcriptional regulator n=1 Tax=Nonomuraea angiospora TaxID=46172 RepID=UPI0033D4EE2B
MDEPMVATSWPGVRVDGAGEERGTPPGPTEALVGRRTELGQILDAIDGDRRGPRTMLLLGEAGTGKTALLAAAAGHARGIGSLVLTARGCEAEVEQSFAALHQLLLPLLPQTDDLPEHQREALKAAFGIVAATRQHDPMPLRVGVLNLLARVSRSRPVLLIADDVQHFDRDTRDVLGFVMRRLATHAVTVLLAARGQTPPDGFNPDLPVLSLAPLSRRAAAHLLDAQPAPPTGRARIDLLEQAAGNPLAIIELSRAVRAGQAVPGGGLPQTLRIQEMFAAQLRALPTGTQRLILYAAASSDHEDLGTIMAAAGAGSDLGVWAPAEDAGLMTVAGGRVAFRHPLVRTASYDGAPAHLRQQVHTDLAAVLDGDPARRAWHLAAACLRQDESVAAALEDTAELAGRRGGFFAAARALERAAECSPEAADRARRYAKALRAAQNAGDPSWVRELYDKVTALTADRDLLGVAACGAGIALSLSGHQRQGFRVLMSALEPDPPKDGMTVLALAAVLQAVAFQSGLPEVRRPIAALLDGLEAAGSSETPYSELTKSDVFEAVRAVALAGADPVNAPELLRRIRRRPGTPEPPAGIADMTRLQAGGAVAWYADESELFVESFRQAYALLTAYGSMGSAAPTLAAMGSALIDTGRWAEAEEHLEETATLAAVQKLRHLEIDVEALRMTLRALRGQPSDLPADPAWTAVGLEENRATHARLLRAAGTSAAAAGDFDGAFRHFRLLFGEDGVPLHYFLSNRSIVDLAAAAQRTGRQEEGARIVAAVRAALGARPTTRMTLLLHHAAALTGEPQDAEHHFRLATVNPAGEQWPLARAQARLHYAQWLRRKRRPLDARPLLATALESFTRLGARGLADEARVELRASGVAAAPAQADPPAELTAQADPLAELTAQQRQIVRLAARGLRNREIAEQLMLSPRTVGSHLYNVYPKLGVSSRHQLRDLFDDL